MCKQDFVCDDLTAISQLLGDQKYLFGDTMTTVDCSLFGHLAQFYYVRLQDYPHKDFLLEKCTNLVEYIKRIEKELWADWEEQCKPEVMENKMVK